MAETKIITATAKGVRQAPRKVGLVASLVRGRSIVDALTILEHTPKRAALPVKKAIASAKANAVNTHGLDEKTLVISTLSVTAGTRLKRYRAGARGMAKPYEKQTSHIHVAVTGAVKPVKKPTAKKAEAKKESK